MNSVYKKEKHHNKKVQQYSPLRQADVMWSRKIWREIDLRQKINHPFYYPENDGLGHTISDRKSLIDVIYSAVLEGSITAYGNPVLDDEFREEMSQEDIKQIGGAKEEIRIKTDWDAVAEGADPEEAKISELIKIPFNRNTVKKWRVKEEWFFDKQRSIMDVRIIGLAPLQEGKDELTEELDGSFNPLFWVYFPEAREILINAEVFNLVKNNAERRTYDDIFWKRMFGSTITKESSVMDRKVNEYMVGLDALLEAERIKTEIFNIEHDLWEY
jgi:gliding motility associated protien GldN